MKELTKVFLAAELAALTFLGAQVKPVEAQDNMNCLPGVDIHNEVAEYSKLYAHRISVQRDIPGKYPTHLEAATDFALEGNHLFTALHLNQSDADLFVKLRIMKTSHAVAFWTETAYLEGLPKNIEDLLNKDMIEVPRDGPPFIREMTQQDLDEIRAEKTAELACERSKLTRYAY